MLVRTRWPRYFLRMISTDRLQLRRPIAADFEATAEMFAEQGVVAHIGGKPLDRPAAWTKFLRDVGHWSIETFGLFSVIERRSGEYVGKVGYARFERDLSDQAGTTIEMSWTLRSQFHGKGYALEAARAAQAWFDGHTPRRTACIISPANLPSRKLAERLGYEVVGQIGPSGHPVLLMTRDPVTRET
ncbi:MAG: GNAT family N-acetyltransferase [Novosphingobium sp.]